MNILIADDHPMVLDALERTAQRAVAHANIHGATSYPEAEQVLASQGPELALIDLNMPGMDGIDGLRRLHDHHPRCRMAAISAQDDAATVQAVLGLGIAGFLPKSETPSRLIQAIHLMLAGGVYVPTRALDSAQAPDAAALTPRQSEVLQLLKLGQPNKLIARQLGLTEGTVKIHVAAILRTLHARNRTEAVVIAHQSASAQPEFSTMA